MLICIKFGLTTTGFLKLRISIIMIGLLFALRVNSQILHNAKPDTLFGYTRFYYNDILQDKSVHLLKGTYLLIFDHKINIDLVELDIRESNGLTPIIYKKIDGLYNISIYKDMDLKFSIDYPVMDDKMKTIAKLFKFEEQILNTKIFSNEFEITDINGRFYDREYFKNSVIIFLYSLTDDLDNITCEVFKNYSQKDVKVVVFNFSKKPDEICFQKNFIFTKDSFWQLEGWIRRDYIKSSQRIIWICDRKGTLQYRNTLEAQYLKYPHQLKTDIREVVIELLGKN